MAKDDQKSSKKNKTAVQEALLQYMEPATKLTTKLKTPTI
jgi:hypothetical protein